MAGAAASLTVLPVMLHYSWSGAGLMHPFELMAAMVYGPEALGGGGATLATGVLVHLITSVLIGALFGMLGGARLPVGASFAAGFIYGAIVWAAMLFVVLPVINPIMAKAWSDEPVWWFVYHLFYGGMLHLSAIFGRVFTGGNVRASLR